MHHADSFFSRRTFLGASAGAVALSAASYGRVLGANDPLTKTVRESLKAMTEG